MINILSQSNFPNFFYSSNFIPPNPPIINKTFTKAKGSVDLLFIIGGLGGVGIGGVKKISKIPTGL